VVLLGLGVLVGSSPLAVRADEIWEVEHARANARAGGPISANDAELLERWGCLSGTNSAFCKRLERKRSRGSYRAAQRRQRR
jgi:hypothetical protein